MASVLLIPLALSAMVLILAWMTHGFGAASLSLVGYWVAAVIAGSVVTMAEDSATDSCAQGGDSHRPGRGRGLGTAAYFTGVAVLVVAFFVEIIVLVRH